MAQQVNTFSQHSDEIQRQLDQLRRPKLSTLWVFTMQLQSVFLTRERGNTLDRQDFRIPATHLTNILDRDRFLTDILTRKEESIKIDEISFNPAFFDFSRFSVQAPCINWQEFQHSIYKGEGGKGPTSLQSLFLLCWHFCHCHNPTSM